MSPRKYITNDYDLTRCADTYITRRFAHHLNTSSGSRYLDIGCGTGNYTLALNNMGIRFTGVDRSPWMLNGARQKSDLIPWCLGTVESLPFLDGSFTGAICVLAIHYFKDILRVFSEVYRVLQRGRFIIFTATPEQMKRYWLNEYFPRAMNRSIARMPGQAEIISALHLAGFSDIEMEPYIIRDDLEDLSLYSGKHQPGIYLDPRVRAGISTFSIDAEPREIQEGCNRLRADIQSGHIKRLISTFEAGCQGDYVFIIGHKR